MDESLIFKIDYLVSPFLSAMCTSLQMHSLPKLPSFWPQMQQLYPVDCTLYLQGVDQPTIQINFSKNANMVGPL